MTKDFLYTKAPLVEVIAELRWKLQPLLAIPNAAVDPHFPLLNQQFGEILKQSEFSRIERLLPDQVPTEMFPHKPLLRYRRQTADWPLIQLGPGLLAMNIVPPYNGWAEFRGFISKVVQWLFQAFPIPEKYLKIETMELHYIDGFTDSLGYSNELAFLNEGLTLGIGIPERLRSLSNDLAGSRISMEIQIPVSKPQGSLAIVKLGPGKVKDQNALVMELLCKREGVDSIQTQAAVLEWMDGAHALLREAFARVTSEKLKQEMGPTIELGESKA
jgi:uncharacterized protein (TIGR04255 family)